MRKFALVVGAQMKLASSTSLSSSVLYKVRRAGGDKRIIGTVLMNVRSGDWMKPQVMFARRQTFPVVSARETGRADGLRRR